MTIDTPARSADQLRGLCDGRVHLLGDPGYDAARVPWNVAVDQRPAAVAIPHSVDEVVEVVRVAAAAGLRVAPQSTGHAAAPLGAVSLDDVVVLKLSELTGVTVDPERRVATVVGGTLWRDVVAAAAPHGLAALHGSAPDVAVAGYLLGGGLSFYSRKHGLAANSVRAVDIVTADGSLLRADADTNPDLFWAVRGGGGNFGVVVRIELDLIPMADPTAGMLLWDRERAPAVIRAWVEWTRDLPESVTTSMRVMSFPPLPELPPFLSGRQIVVMDGAILEDAERAAELLAPLRALTPEMDTFAPLPLTGMTEIHMDPPEPSPAVSDHAVLSDIDVTAIEALLQLVGPGTTTPLLMAELRHLGAALAQPMAGGGAVSCLPGDYLLFCVAMAPTPEMATAGLAAANQVVTALERWSTGTRALNFTDGAGFSETGYDAAAWARLREVRRAVDPQGLFVANHPV
jgi:FAD/FMN-containing dehydrogenase